MNDSEDVQRLIRLKRYETPGEAYYQSFMEDFKERQRAELLRGSARGLLLERIGMWFDELGGAKRLVPAGAMAATAIGLGLYFVLPQRRKPLPPPSPPRMEPPNRRRQRSRRTPSP